ncbi:MAG: biotin--[acetyl-CoA-carboxylase] ligase [Hyphomicrobiaceae bacterium]|nr:biotin--[acetyl-CoA-carboxylase] ligase [Hyphomicrobiaceae bacterium]
MDQSADLPVGWRAASFEEIDSTNSEALRRAASGERGPLWITARFQSKGRGRSGRSWTSAEDSLAATLLLEPGCSSQDLPQLSLVAGVAAHDAIAGVLPAEGRARTRLKWPNDVLIDGAKVTGILVESSILGSCLIAVIGTGINVSAAPALEGRATMSLRQCGASVNSGAMSIRLAQALARWIGEWQGGRRFDRVRSAWLERAGSLGEPMSIRVTGERIAGRFAGLDTDGALLLDTGRGRPRRFTFGDVALGVT